MSQKTQKSRTKLLFSLSRERNTTDGDSLASSTEPTNTTAAAQQECWCNCESPPKVLDESPQRMGRASGRFVPRPKLTSFCHSSICAHHFNPRPSPRSSFGCATGRSMAPFARLLNRSSPKRKRASRSLLGEDEIWKHLSKG